MAEPARVANYARAPWQRDIDHQMLSELNMVGIPRAIREVLTTGPSGTGTTWPR